MIQNKNRYRQRIWLHLWAGVGLGVGLPLLVTTGVWIISWKLYGIFEPFLANFSSGDLLVMASIIIFTFIAEYLFEILNENIASLAWVDTLSLALVLVGILSIASFGFSKSYYLTTFDLLEMGKVSEDYFYSFAWLSIWAVGIAVVGTTLGRVLIAREKVGRMNFSSGGS